MFQKKPWTVMVYLAADNNLTSFGVESLREMKRVGNDTINVVAEFNTGPKNRTRRYLLDGGTPMGSLDQNLLGQFGPTDASNPNNLADFIEWTTDHYPADHYFLIIWGHAGGVDDNFPHSPSRPFALRHDLLRFSKGVLDAPQKGVLDAPQKDVLMALEQGALDSLHKVVLKALNKGLLQALSKEVLETLQDSFSHPRTNGNQNGHGRKPGFQIRDQQLEKLLNSTILANLEQEVLSAFKSGVLQELQERILNALHAGVINALQNGVVFELQEKVIDALKKPRNGSFHTEVCELLQNGVLRSLETGFLEALQSELFDVPPKDMLPLAKSIAFVDHPASFLSNRELKIALQRGKDHIKRKLDIVGMDACNMSMIEIGFEIRDCADFLVASEDDIPDASWPYDRLLTELSSTPGTTPGSLACLTANTYFDSYRDYLDESVTLSALDLNLGRQSLITAFSGLANELRRASADPHNRSEIIKARDNTKNFGRNEFIDVIDFCEHLADASINANVVHAASNLNKQIRPLIVCNKSSKGVQGCNGVSIYFPQVDPINHDRLDRLGEIYSQLEFAKATGWGKFVTSFIEQEKVQIAAAAVTNNRKGKNGGNGNGHGKRAATAIKVGNRKK
jgi:cysteine peptidase C11 family protein